ncbi:hypothetical protein MKEN_01446800 [Mycena kentingensis (nom. inval.)]|nr:hypothetical protein MKEN_01446800 [Mycena kentingensis (nom. inval.)]
MNELTSLYRLFLRTSSAAIMHKTSATFALRKAWRSSFAHALRAAKELQNDALSPPERAELKTWLREWNTRMDKTLALLYGSSQAKGLPSRVTRNLFLLAMGQQHRVNSSFRYPKWNPKRRNDAIEYTVEHVTKHRAKIEKDGEDAEEISAWRGLDEIIQSAEAKGRLDLGKAWWPKRTIFREPT